jgi:hypothetical protein
MRRLALTVTLALLPIASSSPCPVSVARAAQRCPAVVVSCPDIQRPGDEATFNVSVNAAAASVKYTYKWEVSAGSIAGGQGTTSIRVDTTGVAAPVTATVEVGGLAPACANSASCAMAWFDGPRCGRALDEYGDIPFEDEKARLDNFAIELQNDPTATGYLVCYGGRVGYEGEAQSRCNRARDYISNMRGIGVDRLVTVDGGFKESLSVYLWVVPSGATPPAPRPTVDPGEVTILKRKPAHKHRSR